MLHKYHMLRDIVVIVKALASEQVLFNFGKEGEGMAAKAIYKHNFVIIKVATGGYIVHNKDKPFNQGHTHLSSFNAAITAAKLVKRKQLPKNKSDHFIESLKRLADDPEYIERLDNCCNVDYAAMMCNGEIDVDRCVGR